MIALLFLFLAILASFGTLARVFPRFTLSDKIAGALVISIIASTSLVFGLVALVGYNWGIAGGIKILAVLSVIFLPIRKFSIKLPKLSRLDVARLIFATSWSLLFFLLFQHHFLPVTTEGWQTSVNSYGDLALHSTFIEYFAGQEKLNLTSPIYAQLQIHYPFLIDFHSAILLRLGWSLHWSLVVSSLLLMVGCLLAFFNFAWSINKKISTPYVASLLFFFNGGLGWLNFFADLGRSQVQLFSFLSHLSTDYAHNKELEFVWANVITTHVLPQRGFLLGLAVLIVVIRYWQLLWQQKKIVPDQLMILASLIGLLPFFHVHTFLVLAPLHIWLSFWAVQAHKQKWKSATSSLLMMVGLGGLLIWFLLPHQAGEQFVHWQPGWMATGNWLFFWFKNMGVEVIALLATPFLFRLVFPKKKFEQLLILPIMSIFILCNLFIFQPHDWDNMKFFLLSWSIMVILAAAIVTEWVRSWQRAAVVGMVIFLATLAGLLSVLYSAEIQWQIVSNDDLKITEMVKQQTQSGEVFLTSSIHNHPVPMVAGRAVVMGYNGWLWTHGIDYRLTERDVKSMYAGSNTAIELLKKYGIKYMYVGPSEREQFNVNEDFFEQHFPVLLTYKDTTIYRVP